MSWVVSDGIAARGVGTWTSEVNHEAKQDGRGTRQSNEMEGDTLRTDCVFLMKIRVNDSTMRADVLVKLTTRKNANLIQVMT